MIVTPEKAVVAAMLICLLGAPAALAFRRRPLAAGWLAFVAVAASSLLVLQGSISVLWSGAGEAITFLSVPAIGFALRVYVDGLSAIFLSLIAVVAIPAALYSIEYMRHHLEHGVGRYYPCLLLFVVAMYGLVSTTDMMYFFFVFWQMMTFTGWALIRYERRHPENARAANTYLWMMQVACFATMIGAGLLATTEAVSGSGERLMRYDFDAVHHHIGGLLKEHPALVATAFALFLIGFGIKLGMWPFGQIWLPDAHPAAPSPVSALLSGVMIKTGVYGLMRYFLWLVPADSLADYPAARWGMLMALLGTVTLFTGTFLALRQEQSKRLLAFSSIGQAGYILLGLGACLALLPSADPIERTVGVAAFYGALFHTLNHGVFKSLLFLNAGSVLHATGTQDMNKLGGLLRLMPLTGGTALIASLSIAGAPLTSGFASKWGIYQAASQAGAGVRWLPVCAAVAILTSAMTLALLMKFYGSMFLSRTSALVADRAARRDSLEVGGLMRAAQLALATVCLGMGLMPMLGYGLVRKALLASQQGLGGLMAAVKPFHGDAISGVNGLGGGTILAPLVILVLLAGTFAFASWLLGLGGAKRRQDAPWLCGYARQTEANRFRARHLYADIKHLLPWLGGAPRPPAAAAPPASTNDPH